MKYETLCTVTTEPLSYTAASELGKGGWRLVSVIHTKGSFYMFWQRELAA